MNAPAFTKGPWVAAGPNDTSNATVGIHADDFIIADMCDDVPDTFDQHANARLIAAAPELYETLAYAIDNPDFDSAKFDALARAALAKAEQS